MYISASSLVIIPLSSNPSIYLTRSLTAFSKWWEGLELQQQIKVYKGMLASVAVVYGTNFGAIKYLDEVCMYVYMDGRLSKRWQREMRLGCGLARLEPWSLFLFKLPICLCCCGSTADGDLSPADLLPLQLRLIDNPPSLLYLIFPSRQILMWALWRLSVSS